MRAYRKFGPIVAMAGMFAVVAGNASAAEIWRVQEYRNDGFSIEFTGSVVVQETPVSEEAKKTLVRSTAYEQTGPAFSYDVGATLVAGNALNFDAGVKGTIDYFKCAIVADVTPAMTYAVDRIREVHGTQCDNGARHVNGVFLSKGQWFYQILYLVTDDDELPDAEHFLRSFKLISQ